MIDGLVHHIHSMLAKGYINEVNQGTGHGFCMGRFPRLSHFINEHFVISRVYSYKFFYLPMQIGNRKSQKLNGKLKRVIRPTKKKKNFLRTLFE